MLPSEEIREKINIVDLIGEYAPLKKAGANFRAVCPFHQEKTPSFMVSPSKQIWHCFGCGLGGDIFEFVKQIEGVEFPEALEILARRAGITLRKPSVSYQAQTDQKKTLYEINELAARYYSKVLADSSVAKNAREYLASRGFKPDTIAKWQLGYAPEDFHSFENFIVKKGFQVREAAQAGLLSEKDGGYFDRFRGRVMFPIFDLHGRVAGFTARILSQAADVAKYVNSPETPIYSKSRIIYGLNFAKTDIRKTGEVVVVEGNADVITCHEAGFTNVVGSSGTAFTNLQLELLKRLTDNLCFAFDVDEAGLIATRRAVELALHMGFNVKIISIPKALAKDPDELIRKDPALWADSLKNAKNFLDFYFDQVFARIDLQSNTDKKQAAADLLPLISLLPDPIDRSHYTNVISSRLGVDEKIILDLLNKLLATRASAVKDQPGKRISVPARKEKLEILERRVLGLLLRFAKNLVSDWQAMTEDEFFVPALREIFSAAKPQAATGDFSLDHFLSENQKFAGEAELLAFAVENELATIPDWKLDDVKREFFTSLKAEALKKKMNALGALIKQAEHAGRINDVKTLSFEFNNLSRELSKNARKE